ncbi:CLUMA_CG010309, isoform A [Clunio marinus]|uniref:CLUMA_CG010309, isoform A n=1 Tax=Clunio marinus TaxID=568069 RepID=A0A1J1IBC4_9DIPT|nr:CLUMA_CG010309, isoform A [Clunio marinus]
MKASGIMSRRVNLIGIYSIVSFVLLFFAVRSSNYYHTSDQPQQIIQNLSLEIEDVINYERLLIAEEMQDYEYPNGRFGVEAKNLQELTPETGGMPIRSIIISTWRSGSTFFGDILNALPGNFYHYEPMLYFGIKQIRGPPNDTQAITLLKQLLKCNYTGIDDYLEYGENHKNTFSLNSRHWEQCQLFPSYCYQQKFLEPFCKLFPLQSMKVVRLRMEIAASLLRDTSWCPGKPDCDNSTIACEDMVSDYHSAVALAKEFPISFKAVRYEDLSLLPYNITQEILQFYGLAYDRRVSKFLDTHTKTNVGGVSSTIRDSKLAPFHWTQELPYNEVKDIQDNCKEALRLWGYKEATNAILLIRDPRGFLQSRKHRSWCPGKPDCDNSTIACEDMVSDYHSAVALAKEFPMSFKAVRYEDLSLLPYNITQEILQFYGLAYDRRVSKFLDTHTKTNVGGVSSTIRDSKLAPFHWTQELPYNEVKDIQDNCKEALRLWGYKEATNASELLKDFNPLLPFPDFDSI